MHDDNREPPLPAPDPPASAHDTSALGVPPTASAGAPPATVDRGAPEPPPPLEPLPATAVPGALSIWLVLILLFGVGGVWLRQQELALLVTLAGALIAAQAADIHNRWRVFYQLVSLAFIGACAALFVGLAWYFRNSSLPTTLRLGLAAFSGASGLLLIATGLRPVIEPVTRALFRVQETSHSLRLAARLVLVGLLVPLPTWFVAQDVFADPESAMQTLGDIAQAGTVFGYILVALAAVGFLVRRDLRATFERLGLGRIGGRYALVAALGVPVMFGINAGADWVQHHWLPDLWESDRRVNEAIAGALDARSMIVVGVSAGIGEEITMRGALQPRLGIVLTALLFSLLHVQYSWFGMATVFLFGLMLGAVRKRTNTTVVIMIHMVYDVLALFTT